VTKGVEDSRRPPALFQVACTLGLEGLCVAGLGEVLGSPGPPIAVFLCRCVQQEAAPILADRLDGKWRFKAKSN
jgi:hypothetical protein